ncbi:MAG: Gfo/Idh/MocA family oxidoreductase [Tissierellaceae bacterium]|nr:Gfo/Idh/MocA family oxidoreductase [Tissierellaceae bacterium]
MKNFRTGVIGTGFIGVAHVEALRRLGFVDVVAIAAPNSAKEKAEAMGISHYFTDYREMIDTMALDVVHICTPNNTHYEMAIYALQQGVNVVCEKPLSCTVEEAKEMLEVANKNDLVHAVNFHNRFYPMTYEIKEMIKTGTIGNIFTIHGGYIQDWLLYDTDYNWRLQSKESGKTRAVSDIGSHWMDLVQFVTGTKIIEVFAEFKTVHPVRKMPMKPVEAFAKTKFREEDYKDFNIDTEDFAAILLRFSNGAVGSVVVSQVFAGKKNKMNLFIAGSKKSVEWDADDHSNLIIGNREKANEVLTKDPSIVSNTTRGIISYPGGHSEGFPDAFKQNFRQIYNYISDRSKPKEFANFEDGLYQMIVNQSIYESAKLGKWIKIYY